jgi:hypothetical protein
MSRPFSNYSAKATFGQVKEPISAREYIISKKTKYSFCNPDICHPNKNVYSQSNLLRLRQANNMAFYPCNNFDKQQLYSNLYTKLDLSDLSENTPVISDLSGNFPVNIKTNVTPYLSYNIDPSGNLFGNTVCGINNYLNYVTFDVSFNGLF